MLTYSFWRVGLDSTSACTLCRSPTSSLNLPKMVLNRCDTTVHCIPHAGHACPHVALSDPRGKVSVVSTGCFPFDFFLYCMTWYGMVNGSEDSKKKTLTASASRLASLARMSESRFHFFHESWVLYFLNIVVRLVCGRKRSTTPCWFSLYTVHSRISWQRERRILATATPRRDRRGEAGTTYRILHLKYLEIYLSHLVQRFTICRNLSLELWFGRGIQAAFTEPKGTKETCRQTLSEGDLRGKLGLQKSIWLEQDNL